MNSSQVLSLLESGADPALIKSCATSPAICANIIAGNKFFISVLECARNKPGGINAILKEWQGQFEGSYLAVIGGRLGTRALPPALAFEISCLTHSPLPSPWAEAGEMLIVAANAVATIEAHRLGGAAVQCFAACPVSTQAACAAPVAPWQQQAPAGSVCLRAVSPHQVLHAPALAPAQLIPGPHSILQARLKEAMRLADLQKQACAEQADESLGEYGSGRIKPIFIAAATSRAFTSALVLVCSRGSADEDGVQAFMAGIDANARWASAGLEGFFCLTTRLSQRVVCSLPA